MRTFRPLVVLALVLAVAAGCSDDGGDDDAADTRTTTEADGTSAPEDTGDTEPASGDAVVMSSTAFAPETLTVAVGTEVTWTNEDPTTHTATAEDGAWDSGDLNSGDTFSHTFEEAGTFAYVCQIHSSMQAEVVVE